MSRIKANEVGTVDPKSVAVGWIKFDKDAVVDDFFGICTSVTFLGASLWRVNFSQPMANTDYGIWLTNDDLASGASAGSYVRAAGKTVNYFEFRCTHHPSNTAINHNHYSAMVFGEVA